MRLTILILLSVVTAGAARAGVAPDAAAAASIYDARDPRLQRELVRTIGRLRLDRAIADQRLALAIADVTDITAPRVADLNGDVMLYAASLPKLAILLGVFQRSEREGLPIDAALAEDLVQMIRYSSNPAATRALAWVGRDELIEILESPGIELYDPDHNGGLWVGKDYAPAQAYRRDPLHGLSHGATALQVVRFYYLLEAGRLANDENTRRMKEILSDPGIVHKFVKGLEAKPRLQIYRKSGTWREFHADSALVESARGRFILVGLAADPDGGEWLERLAIPLYDLLATAAGTHQLARCDAIARRHRAAGSLACVTSAAGDGGAWSEPISR